MLSGEIALRAGSDGPARRMAVQQKVICLLSKGFFKLIGAVVNLDDDRLFDYVAILIKMHLAGQALYSSFARASIIACFSVEPAFLIASAII